MTTTLLLSVACLLALIASASASVKLFAASFSLQSKLAAVSFALIALSGAGFVLGGLVEDRAVKLIAFYWQQLVLVLPGVFFYTSGKGTEQDEKRPEWLSVVAGAYISLFLLALAFNPWLVLLFKVKGSPGVAFGVSVQPLMRVFLLCGVLLSASSHTLLYLTHRNNSRSQASIARRLSIISAGTTVAIMLCLLIPGLWVGQLFVLLNAPGALYCLFTVCKTDAATDASEKAAEFALFEASAEPALVVDQTGAVLKLNAQGEDLLASHFPKLDSRLYAIELLRLSGVDSVVQALSGRNFCETPVRLNNEHFLFQIETAAPQSSANGIFAFRLIKAPASKPEFAPYASRSIAEAPLAYAEWSSNYRVEYWNPAAEILFGFRAEEMIGARGLERLALPETRSSISEMLDKARINAKSFSGVHVCIDRKGAELVCEWHYAPRLNRNGEAVSVAALILNVSERYDMIGELVEKNIELENIFKAIPDLYLRLSEDGVALDFHGSEPNPLGLARNTVLQQSIYNFMPEAARESFRDAISSAGISGKMRSAIIKLTGDQNDAFIEFRIQPVHDGEFVVVFRDVSERKRSEAELLKKNQMLSRYSKALQELHKISAQKNDADNRSFSPLYQQYLKAGIRIFETQCGVILDHKKDRLWVRSVVGTREVKFGDLHPFANSESEQTLKTEGARFINVPSGARPLNFLGFQVRALYETPIKVNGACYGFLAYFDGEQKDRQLDAVSAEMLEYAAEIIGKTIALQLEEQKRQRMQNELNTSVKRYQGLVETQRDLIVRTNTKQKVLFANEAFCDTFSTNAEEVVGKRIYEIADWYQQPSHSQMLDRITRPPFRMTTEVRARTPRGWRWYAVENYFIRSAIGKHVEIQSVGRDVTEHILMEQALRRKEARFRSLAANSPDFILIYNIALREFTYSNREIFLDHPTRRFKQQGDLLKHVHPQDQNRLNEAWDEFLSSDRLDVSSIEFRMSNATGNWEWVRSRMKMLGPEDHEEAGEALITNTVITERRAAEERAAFQAEMLNQVYSAAIALDLTGKIQFWNNYASQMLAYSAEETMGAYVERLLAPSDREDHFRSIRREVAKGAQYQGELNVLRKDGKIIPALASVSLVFDQDKKPVAVLAILADISKQKAAEAELTAAKEAAEAATVEKSNFLAITSHEIRTPLNTIIGYAELLDKTRLNDEQAEYARTVKSSGESLLALINNILDFSKIESGKMELEARPIDLAALLEEVAGMFYPQIRDKGLDLLLLADQAMPATIIGDYTRLQQIIVNLVGNAVKFTNQGFVALEVKTLEVSLQSTKLEFVVSDTGIGIPPEKAHKLFKPFSQVDATTTRKFGGTGLGLVICSRLAELMEGQIQAVNRIDRGAQFVFRASFQTATFPVRPAFEFETLINARADFIGPNSENNQFLIRQLVYWDIEVEHYSDFNLFYNNKSSAQRPAENEKRGDILIVSNLSSDELTGLLTWKKTLSSQPVVYICEIGEPAPPENVRRHFENLFFVSRPIRISELFKALQYAVVGKKRAASSSATQKVELNNLAEEYPLRLLVAEDHPVNRKMIGLILNKMGYEPEFALDGKEAYEKATSNEYDLIFMDIQMPEMDGVEASMKILERFNQTGSAPPLIVAMTANATSSDKDKCLAAGMTDYISKPVKIDLLKERLAYFSRLVIEVKKTGEDPQ